MRLVAFLAVIWCGVSLIYSLVQFLLYGFGTVSDENLYLFTTIYLCLNIPYFFPLIVKAVWLRKDTLYMRKCLIPSMIVMVVTIVITMLWYTVGAYIMFGGIPSMRGYIFEVFPDTRGIDDLGCNPDGIC